MLMPRPAGPLVEKALALREHYIPPKVVPKRSHLDKWKEKGTVLLRTTEIAAVSAAFGHRHGSTGAPMIGPMPGDLLMGIIGHVVGFTGALGGFTEHAHALADGAVASYAHTWGRGKGRESRMRAGLPPLIAGSMGAMPLPDATGGGSLSNDELNKLRERL